MLLRLLAKGRKATWLMGKSTPKRSDCPQLIYVSSTPPAPIWGSRHSLLHRSPLPELCATKQRRQPRPGWHPHVPSAALTWSISNCSLSASSSVSSLILGSFASCFASLASFAALSAFSRRSASWRAFFSFRSFWASLLWWLKVSVISWKTGTHNKRFKEKKRHFFKPKWLSTKALRTC